MGRSICRNALCHHVEGCMPFQSSPSPSFYYYPVRRIISKQYWIFSNEAMTKNEFIFDEFTSNSNSVLSWYDQEWYHFLYIYMYLVDKIWIIKSSLTRSKQYWLSKMIFCKNQTTSVGVSILWCWYSLTLLTMFAEKIRWKHYAN